MQREGANIAYSLTFLIQFTWGCTVLVTERKILPDSKRLWKRTAVSPTLNIEQRMADWRCYCPRTKVT